MQINNNFFAHLPSEITEEIISYLPPKTLLSFEAADRDHVQYTHRAWRQLSKHLFCLGKYRWDCTKGEKYPHRAQVVIGNVVDCYLRHIFALLSNNQFQPLPPATKQEVYNRYEGIMIRYPALGGFLFRDLSEGSSIISDKKSLFEPAIKILLDSQKPKAGEWMVRGLLKAKEFVATPAGPAATKILGAAFQCLNKAISKRATTSSLYAYCILGPYRLQETQSLIFQLDIAAASREDFEPLDENLSRFLSLADVYYNSGILYPPVLMYKARSLSLEQTQEKEELYDQALANWENPTIRALFEILTFKETAGKWADVEKISQRIISDTFGGGSDLGAAYSRNGFAKFLLGRIKEAEYCYGLALTILGDQAVAPTLFNAARVEWDLGNLKKCEMLVDRALARPRTENTYHILGAADIKHHLLKWEEAERLYQEGFSTERVNLDPETCLNYAFTSLVLGNRKRFHDLIEQVMELVEGLEEPRYDRVLQAMNAYTAIEMGSFRLLSGTSLLGTPRLLPGQSLLGIPKEEPPL